MYATPPAVRSVNEGSGVMGGTTAEGCRNERGQMHLEWSRSQSAYFTAGTDLSASPTVITTT